MKKLIFTTILLIILIAVLAFIGNAMYNNSLDPEGVYGAECPVCEPCKITAKSIKENVLDYSGQRFENMTKIKLPNSIDLIQIGEDTYTKVQLDTIKLEAIK